MFRLCSLHGHEGLGHRTDTEPLNQLIAAEATAVRYAKDWPAAHTLPAHVGARVIRVKQPPHYLDPNNPKWPEVIELRLEMPLALEFDYGAVRRSRTRSTRLASNGADVGRILFSRGAVQPAWYGECCSPDGQQASVRTSRQRGPVTVAKQASEFYRQAMQVIPVESFASIRQAKDNCWSWDRRN